MTITDEDRIHDAQISCEVAYFASNAIGTILSCAPSASSEHLHACMNGFRLLAMHLEELEGINHLPVFSVIKKVSNGSTHEGTFSAGSATEYLVKLAEYFVRNLCQKLSILPADLARRSPRMTEAFQRDWPSLRTMFHNQESGSTGGEHVLMRFDGHEEDGKPKAIPVQYPSLRGIEKLREESLWEKEHLSNDVIYEHAQTPEQGGKVAALLDTKMMQHEDGSDYSDGLDKEVQAIATIRKWQLEGKSWTEKDVADAVDVNRRTLYKWPLYRTAKQGMKFADSPPVRGSKANGIADAGIEDYEIED